MSTNLKIIENTVEPIAASSPSFLDKLLTEIYGSSVSISPSTSDEHDLNTALSFGFSLYDNIQVLALPGIVKTNYFSILNVIASFIKNNKFHLELINPNKVQFENEQYFCFNGIFPAGVTNNDQKICIYGSKPDIFTQLSHMEVAQNLYRFATQREDFKIYLDLQNLDDLNNTKLYLRNKQKCLQVKFCRIKGVGTMEIMENVPEATIDQLTLRVCLGQLSISMTDFIKLKTGSIIEIANSQQLSGVLEFSDGAELADITLEPSDTGYNIRVTKLNL